MRFDYVLRCIARTGCVRAEQRFHLVWLWRCSGTGVFRHLRGEVSSADIIWYFRHFQDDEWGPFSDAGAQDFDFPPSTAPAADNPFAPRENLTPADWAAEFRREGTPEAPPPDDDGDDTSSSGGRDDEGTPTFGTSPTASFGTSPPAPFVDLGDVVAAAHRRRP